MCSSQSASHQPSCLVAWIPVLEDHAALVVSGHWSTHRYPCVGWFSSTNSWSEVTVGICIQEGPGTNSFKGIRLGELGFCLDCRLSARHVAISLRKAPLVSQTMNLTPKEPKRCCQLVGMWLSQISFDTLNVYLSLFWGLFCLLCYRGHWRWDTGKVQIELGTSTWVTQALPANIMIPALVWGTGPLILGDIQSCGLWPQAADR